MRRFAIALLALAAINLLPAAATAEARSSFFRAKPSGITCGALRLGRSSATVRCDLRFSGSRAAFLHTMGKGEIKRVSSFLHPRRRLVLYSGDVRAFGPFTCASRATVVTCRTHGGHGFTVGRAFQLVF
jgi:hypothetical protein